MSGQRLWPAVLAGWGLAALVLTVVSARAIAHLWFPDPDDAMRLLEVRDWLAGQSWWDVSQHRLNGGDFPMHWSRLVDLPLAAFMVVLDPLVGTAASTRAALTIVPLLTLLSVMTLAADLTRRLGDIDQAKMSILIVPLSVPLLYQLIPLRIDHHGWQVALALAAVIAVIARPCARTGAVAGISLATLVTISLEGLPITVVIASVALVAWAIDDRRRAQALSLIWSLTIGVTVLQVATRGPAMFAPACDAIAPGWIAALGVAALGVSILFLFPRLSRWARLMGLACVAAASLATWLTIAPDCTRGPFATLDPIVYRLWYRNVSEGLAIWDQIPGWALMTMALPLVGLSGTITAFRSHHGEARGRWGMLLAMLVAATILSLLVVRAGATANALAVPGAASILHALITRARRVKQISLRTLATAGAFVVATPGITAGAVMASARMAAPRENMRTDTLARATCNRSYEVSALAVLPPSILFAPIDATPQLMATTAHHAVAAGYHRNSGAIARVIRTFTGPVAQARAEIAQTGAAYVVGCPGVNELELYKHVAPNGFWARLERGERFDWLTPVPIAGSPVLVWRVIDPGAHALSANRRLLIPRSGS